MNIKMKIIITDTNIITDLNNANILKEFITLPNVYISDLLKNDEINTKTGDVSIISKLKVIETNENQLLELTALARDEHKLSYYDLLNYIIARDNNGMLATGDKALRRYALARKIEVIRTLTIIKYMYEQNIISKSKVIKAGKLLKENPKTRIPEEEIDKLIRDISENIQ